MVRQSTAAARPAFWLGILVKRGIVHIDLHFLHTLVYSTLARFHYARTVSPLRKASRVSMGGGRERASGGTPTARHSHDGNSP